MLAPAQRTSLTVTFPASCDAQPGFVFFVHVKGGKPIRFEAAAAPASDWDALSAFLWAFAAEIGLSFLTYVFFFYRLFQRLRHPRSKRPTVPTHKFWSGLNAGLNGLDTSWSFADSWASNVTAGAGVIVAVLGSSNVLSSVLGQSATAPQAVATVAGLIGPALIGGAGVVATIFRQRKESDDVVVLGLLLATSVGLAAGLGQVWALFWALDDARISSLWMYALAASAVSIVLLVYGYTSVTDLLFKGFDDPPPADPFSTATPELAAAAIIAEAISHKPYDHAAVAGVLTALMPPAAESDAPAAGASVVALRVLRPRPLARRSVMP